MKTREEGAATHILANLSTLATHREENGPLLAMHLATSLRLVSGPSHRKYRVCEDLRNRSLPSVEEKSRRMKVDDEGKFKLNVERWMIWYDKCRPFLERRNRGRPPAVGTMPILRL